MKNTKVLTKTQKLFLDLFCSSPLVNDFYLTGGTALTGFYVPYRLSEDLDFFSEKEFEVLTVISFLKSIKDRIGYKEMDINTSFNRNLIFLKFDKFVLKTEFTYFPFPRIDESNKYQKVNVDSELDIAVNKLFTIYQKPRSRDFMDLYMLCKKNGFVINDLIKKAKSKFDWHVDLLKLGSQFLLATDLSDYPHLLTKLGEKDWQDFFMSEAKKLKGSILT